METKDATLLLTMADQELAGSMSRKSETVETAESVSAEKLRHKIVSDIDETSVIIEGQEQPGSEQGNPLVGVPVILEVKDGKLAASLEEGSPTEEQQVELEKILKRYDSTEDLVMYGGVPRKPGDSWDVDPSELSNFAGGTGLAGTFTVEFMGVEEINGVNCAKLECVFELKGEAISEAEEPGMAIAINGKADVVRSIQDLVDLDVKLIGTVTVEGAPAEGMKMSVNGPFEMRQTAELE